jgi:hypothetical protein
MQECLLKRDNFECILRHCNVLTRVSMAKTCRFMRAYLNNSPLLKDWSELSVFDRMMLAVKTHSNYNFIDMSLHMYLSNYFLELLVVTSIHYTNLDILDMLMQHVLCKRIYWFSNFPSVPYNVGRSENMTLFLRFEEYFKNGSIIQVVEGAASTGNLKWLDTCISTLNLHENDLCHLKPYIERGFKRAQVQLPFKYASLENVSIHYIPWKNQHFLGEMCEENNLPLDEIWKIPHDTILFNRPELMQLCLHELKKKVNILTEDDWRILLLEIILHCNLNVLQSVIDHCDVSSMKDFNFWILEESLRCGKMDIFVYYFDQFSFENYGFYISKLTEMKMDPAFENVTLKLFLHRRAQTLLKKRRVL